MTTIIQYGDFEIEVGSAAYERLVTEGKIEAVEAAELEEIGGDAGEAVDPLAELNVAELRELAGSLEVEHKGLNKAKLIDAIKAAQHDSAGTLND